MRRRIKRSAEGPAPVNVAAPNAAVFHVKTHHDKELSRLSKGTREATIQLPLTGQRNNSSNRAQDLRAVATGILPSADNQPAVAPVRRTRREVRLGTFDQSTALVPASRPQQLTTFDGDNNVRFKIHVTDQKGAERPTKILATLATGASLQRQDGVVKLTRSSFHTPTVREIHSNEDICQTEKEKSSERLKSAKNAHNLWNEALVTQSDNVKNDVDQSSNRPQQRVKSKGENPPLHSRREVGNQWTQYSEQEQCRYQEKQASPESKFPSPPFSPSSSEERSDDSLTRSNETRSNLYGYRRIPRESERYQQGASILKTQTPNAALRRRFPGFPQNDPYYARMQPPVQSLPSTRPSVQPCVTCQYAPCSTCRAPICVMCMAEPCASCCAPLCSACNIVSYSTNNETLCMSCALGCYPLYGSHQAYSNNRSSTKHHRRTPPQSPKHSQQEEDPSNLQPRESRNSSIPSVPALPINPTMPSNPTLPSIPTYRLQCDIPPACCSPRSVPRYRSDGPLPPGYPRHLSPCSPYIDWATRRNLPPLIPNYVCEPVACNPSDAVPDDVSCQTAPFFPRKNQFLEMISGKPSGSVQGSPSYCCQQQANMGDTASVICPASWIRCGPQRSQPCTQYQWQTQNSCVATVLNVVWIVLPIIVTYALAYMGVVKLLSLNKFSRLAAVMANATLLYIINLEPDDLIIYPTDKPKMKQAVRPALVCPTPSPAARALDLSCSDACRAPLSEPVMY